MDAQNVTADTFSQTPVTLNTHGENENEILISERLDKLDALAETLNNLTINGARYYESDSANVDDAKSDPASDPKAANQTSDEKKRKVTDTSNEDSQQKLLSNRTLLIITTGIGPRIDNRFETCGGTPHVLATPNMKVVITDASRRSANVIRTTGHMIRTGRDGTNPSDCNVSVRSPWMNSPVLIGGTTMSPACGIIGSLEILNIHGSTGSLEIGDTQKFDTSVDGNFSEDGYYITIFSKVIG